MSAVDPRIRRWLAERIVRVDSVRHCVMNRAGDPPIDIQAMTWSSAFINVYLFAALEKARTLKRLIAENTRVGIGTLIVVDHALAPADGEKLIPNDMLIACHALFKDKIYTYRMDGDTPKIGQVHFKSFGRGDEREVWYGPDLEVQHLPCYRVSVPSPGSIKGSWLIAGFGALPFWKSADYAAGRATFRQQQHSGFTRHATWNNADWTNGSATDDDAEAVEEDRQRVGVSAETRLDVCYRELGVGRGAAFDDVKAAFRKLARELHPDVSHLPKAEAESRFKSLNEAYMYIKAANKRGS